MASIGLPGIQRVYRRVGGADRQLARISLDGLDRRVGHPDRHCLFVARAAGYFLWRAARATPEQALPPITLPERLGACLLLASTIVLGLYPRLLMDLILPSLNGPLFEQLRQGGWR